ncbi:MAG: hypothetical protein JNM85_00775 [Chthonomonas sp.]|nr:hypothetical protein [Chthonomonas sp.]
MRSGRDWVGSLVGIGTFVLGIVLLAVTFKIAIELFSTPPEVAVGIKKGEPIDVGATARLGMWLTMRVVMLLLMCFISSVITSRGIKLYSARREAAPDPAPTPTSSEPS